MNYTLVKNIQLPTDEVLNNPNVRNDSRDLPIGNAEEIYVEYVIENIEEAVKAYCEDFCCNKGIYFTIEYGGEKVDFPLDFSNFNHLIGLPAEKNRWKTTDVVINLLRRNPRLAEKIKSQHWIDQIATILHKDYKHDIILNECFSTTGRRERLNWEKMTVKIFSLINLGLLEQGTTFLYKEERNKNSKGNPKYLLVRSLRNGELENIENSSDKYYNKQLVVVLVETSYDGKIILEPKSIMIISKPLNLDNTRNKKCIDSKIIKLLQSTFKFKAIPTITRVRGDRYVNKGNK